jgi:D-glycero-alpha-D-manno-heptose-7-phosphate kinase
VSNAQIDEVYQARRDAGAVGGKCSTPAAAGFMVLLVDPDKRAQVHERLNRLVHVNVGLDTEGSEIVIYQPEEV